MKTCLHKALFIILFIVIYKPLLLSAQSLNAGDNIISAGYGFGVVDGDEDYTSSQSSYSFTGPFYLKFENAITDKLTIGINLAYGKYIQVTPVDGYSFLSNGYVSSIETQTYTSFSALARLNWHFSKLNKFDPYWGFGVGYRYAQSKTTSNDPYAEDNGTIENYFPLGFEITIGARYYISNSVAFYMETGIAKSVVQVGLSFKLNNKHSVVKNL